MMMTLTLRQELDSNEETEHTYPTPLAIGRTRESLPNTYQGELVSPLILDNKKVSRNHAIIYEVDGMIYIEDQSTNGVFVNQERIHRKHRLQTSDRITIGDCIFTVILPINLDTNETQGTVDTNFGEETQVTSATV